MTEFDLLNLKYNHIEDARLDMSRILAERARQFSLPQSLYNDPFLFRIDMEEVFMKEWLFVGMACEIPSPGAYMTVDIGQNPVLVVRDRDGGIRAFHNVCRHRGSRVCTGKRGKVANLTCPYHQWTYDLKGDLIYAGTEMGEGFDKSDFGLKPAHCKTAGGFIYVCLAEHEPPEIDQYLAALEAYMEPYDMENAKVAAESTLEENANWKLVIENNRECYHCSGSHPELLRTLLEWDDTTDPRATPEFKAQYERQAAEWDREGIPHKHVEFGLRNRIVRMPLKDGTAVMTMDGKPACKKRMGRIQNPNLGSMRLLHLPNSWNHMQSDHMIVFQVQPVSAQKTLVTTKWLVHKDAVEGEDYDPAQLSYVWDQTNKQDRELAEQNQRGINSLAYQPGPYSETYEFGIINFLDWYADTVLKNLTHDRL
ncbi:glycine-betaine demethylase subunit GbcA [Marinobacter nanhaiticus D15-8W]|uniref:Aromatic ring-hydroxylating dioxygenase subunit alpha n=1 Tax=Marinobacter nanhaiticus D15-8W TaxID=626887 RepID=N6WZ12_9GAMM|nr:aromatic ring-hydroxylating dioxygenase subunit alpha [Marinobacter nanhaiticus]ENO14018.1 aromatic ring-hydroxylating dioxygenase subunit alpha [Marinobacter nanhaiticus D15-8W]BES71396.1 glycine-betaine demethylase subunit GbcA [Marinobacter nanhaiticus D15-8W]